MYEEKKWYQSLTIQASTIVVVLNILAIFGVDVSRIIPEADNIAGVITAAATLIGSVVAIIGRIRAKAKIE